MHRIRYTSKCLQTCICTLLLREVTPSFKVSRLVNMIIHSDGDILRKLKQPDMSSLEIMVDVWTSTRKTHSGE